jgi:ABC-type branched-subunit amino acid transport system ATPase component/predicted MFS family arabinose efflux permease
MTGRDVTSHDQLEAVRAGEVAIDVLEREARELTGRSLAALGFGSGDRAPGLREGIRRSGAGWSTVIRVAILTVPLMFLNLVFLRFDPAIASTLGLDPLGYEFPGLLNSLIIPVFVLGVAAAGLVCARLVFRHRWRGRASMAAAFGYAIGMWCAAFATGEWGLLIAVLISGFAVGIAYSSTVSLVMDAYPPDVRVRVITLMVVGVATGAVLGNFVLAFSYDVYSLTWRGVLMILAGIGSVLAFASVGLRDRGVGRFDLERIDEIVRERVGERGTQQAELSEEDVSVRFSEQIRQVFATRSALAMAIVFFLFGTLLVPFQAFVAQFVVARYQWSFTDRTWLFVGLSAVGVVPLVVLLIWGDRWFRDKPARLTTLVAGLSILGGIAVVVVAFVTNEVVTVAGFALAYLGVYLILVVAYVVMLSVIDPHLRPHAGALSGLLIASAVLVGGVVAGQLSDRYGITSALVFFALTFLGVGGAMRAASAAMNGDVTSLVVAETEREELVVRVSSGQHFPLLGCRNIDFSYGKLQVLFGVDFTVDDGELVALLGTNGAGKSTLLKVISGLGKPSRGSIHYRGADITYIDPVRRVEHGIAQMPGGRSVFAGLSVAENLRMHGFTLRKSHRELERGIEETFDAFPVLAARRNQAAATLSGGEQQMLALGKAFILRPRLLLIDELSLGLAPLIVGELIAMVRRINAAGTAVVVVEQSVNIALTLVDHAYFMERGQMRFDGVANELIERPDLLRSVFLEGASKGLESMSSPPAAEGA